MASPADSNSLDVPEIMPFQFDASGNGSLRQSVNLFRGDVSFYFTLVSLPGRNGLDTKVSALYRSNVAEAANQWNLTGPTSVLGLGWHLPFDRISAEQGGAGTGASRTFFLVHGDARERLYRSSRRWQRGTLAASFATQLNAGSISAGLAQAFRDQGLQVDLTAPVRVLASGQRWRIADPVNEHTLDVERDAQGLAVFDGGHAYELEGFDFSRIRYYPEYERWELTHTNGSTSVFGGGLTTNVDGTHGSAGNSIQWGVRWESWLGPSALTHDPAAPATRLQSQYPTDWGYSGSYTAWGDRVRFEYTQVLQRVGADGLPYTKACYLAKITDVFGRTSVFHYAGKTFDTSSPESPREYLDPHKPVPDDHPDAFQSRYETRYLKSIDVFNEDGEALYTLTLGYELRSFATLSPNDPPSMYGDTIKRVLTSITRTLPEGTGLPNVELSYYAGADTHPGAIKSILYPEGGTVTYLYQKKELPDCPRHLKLDNPFPQGSPRVWFGPDYAVVTWYDGQGKLKLGLYTWVGRWQLWQPPQEFINAFVNLDSLSAVTQQDFVVLHYAVANKQSTECWVFHKDNTILGGWRAHGQGPIVLGTTDREVVGGTDFFAINDRLANTVTRYTWSGLSRAWTSSPLAGACDPGATGRTRFFITASNNILLSLCYDVDGAPGGKKNRLRLDYLDELGAWQTGDSSSAPEISIAGTDLDRSFTWTPESWVMAATFVTRDEQVSFNYRLCLYQWGAAGAGAYKLKPVTTRDYLQQRSAPSSTLAYDYTAQVSGTGLVTSGSHLLRFNGLTWLDNDNLAPQLPFSDGNVFWFGYGPDYAVKTESSPERVIGAVQAYDANTQLTAWTGQAITLFDGAPTLPRMSHYFPSGGPDLLTWNNKVYARGSSNNWVIPLQNPIYRLPEGVDTSTLVNESPSFLANLIEDSAGKEVLGTQLTVLRNGRVFASETLNERFFRVVKEDGSYETRIDGRLPGGPGAFFTYLPLNADIDQARSITLYRFVGDSVSRPLQDFPAYAVVMNDGLGTTEFSFSFDETTAACDPTGRVAKYFKTVVAPGGTPGSSSAGWTEYHFINSLGNLEPHTNPSVSAALDGQLKRRLTYDAAGKLAATSWSDWKIQHQIAGRPGGPPDVPIYGAYIQATSLTQQQDGVEVKTAYTYDAASGQQVQQQVESYNGSGKLETRRSFIRYGYQTYPALWFANNLGETVQSRKTVQEAGGGELVTEVKVTTWQPYPRPLGDGATIAVWATYKMYAWLGGAGSSDFDFTAWSGGQEPPSGWLKASQIFQRSPHGPVTEKQSPMGVATSTLYDRLGGMSVASFSRASLSRGEAFYYGFEPYEAPPANWALNPSATPIVGGLSNTGRRCLRLPPAAVAAPIQLSVSPASRQYLFAFWAYAGAAYDPSKPTGWTLQVGGGTPIDVPVRAGPDWQYHAQVVELAASGAAIPIRITPYNRGAADVYLDDVSFAAYQGQLSVSVYEGASYRVTAELGPYEGLLRRQYDPWERQIARTDDAQSILRAVVPYLARQDAAAVSPANLNSEIHLQPMGVTLYDRFYNLGHWQDHWSSATPAQWTSANGRLIHAQGNAGAITLVNPALTRDYFAMVSVLPLEAVNQPLGIRLGDHLTVSWSPVTRTWTLADTLNGTTRTAPFQSPTPGRRWFVALTGSAVLFAVDGRLVFSDLPALMPSGSLQLFTGNEVAFSELLAGASPQLGIQLSDGATKLRQGHSIEGPQYVVTETVYDDLGRPAVLTKPAAFPATAGHPLLVYRPSFVEGMDWVSGVMTGDVSRAHPEDQGYPYHRQRFEASPLGRVLESGAPGKDFAIVDINSPPERRHTTRYQYGANQEGGFPAGLNLPAGQYALRISIDPDGNRSAAVSDKLGNQVASGAVVDPGTGRYSLTSYLTTYAADRRVETVRLPNYHSPPEGSPPGSWQRRVTYDFLGRKVSFEGPDGGASRFIYDPIGLLRFSQDAATAAAGTIAYRKYDATQRPIEEGLIKLAWDPAALQAKANQAPDWPTAADGAVPQRAFEYDGDGMEITQMGMLTRARVIGSGTPAAPAVTLAFTYDARTRLRSQTLSTPAVSPTPAVTRYEYDNLGNLVSTTYPSGNKVLHRYDPVGRVQALVDGGGKLLARYTYSAGDQLLSETLSPGTAAQVVTSYRYNSPGWLTSIQSPLLTETLDYMSGGYQGGGYYSGKPASVTARLTVAGPGKFPAALTYQLAYDPLGRLTVAQCSSNGTPQPQWSLGLAAPVTYDDNGNFRAVKAGEVQERYTYSPGSDQVLNTRGAAGGRDYEYSPDGAVTRAAPRGIQDIQYNLLSRLPSLITTAQHGKLQLDYDNQGRRTVKQTAAGSRRYVRNPSGWSLSEQTTAPGGAPETLEYIYGPSGLIALRNSGGMRVVLRDHLKSIRAVVGQDGSLLSAFQYQPFGGLITPSHGAAGDLSYYFTGYELDSETGLYNAVARLYDPALRRFYSTDPKLQFASPYLYGGNSPFIAVDPSGEAAWWAILVGAIVGSIVTLATGGAGAFLFGTEVAVAAAVGATAGAAGALAGDVTTAAIAGEPITAQRLLTDVVSGGVGGAVGAGVGGMLGRGAMNVAFSRGLSALNVSRIGAAVSILSGGVSGSMASSVVSSAMSGQPFFSAQTALNIGIGTLAGMGGALMATGAHFGLMGNILPLELTANDFNLIAEDNVTAGLNSPGDAHYNYAANVLAESGGTEVFLGFVPRDQFLSTGASLRQQNINPFVLNGARSDVVAIHGIGRYVFPVTTAGYLRPMRSDLFAQFLAQRYPGFVGRAQPIKMYICFSALPKPFGSGTPGFSGSVGQVLATSLNRNTYGGRWFVYPTNTAQNWIPFTP